MSSRRMTASVPFSDVNTSKVYFPKLTLSNRVGQGVRGAGFIPQERGRSTALEEIECACDYDAPSGLKVRAPGRGIYPAGMCEGPSCPFGLPEHLRRRGILRTEVRAPQRTRTQIRPLWSS